LICKQFWDLYTSVYGLPSRTRYQSWLIITRSRVRFPIGATKFESKKNTRTWLNMTAESGVKKNIKNFTFFVVIQLIRPMLIYLTCRIKIITIKQFCVIWDLSKVIFGPYISCFRVLTSFVCSFRIVVQASN
jgi:hypothetical protein